MILDFNFTSTSSECSDGPVLLQSLARSFAVCMYTQNMGADGDTDNANNIKMVTIKIVNETLR